ncbi:NAD-dependent epimerase/dehydratase family protein [Polynucleobacter sp. AM-25C3]|uniref:UDP-2-acetamido-2,6-beta-L-arabino-hexul-4-ose reductase n=1 Tax=Polynucleobacter sp. AM-25C3 TaxID=1855569 RepID=UPI001C0D50D5|nr:NAD-dependent epimerase/dehydratase family protein [Polynucleobacter sp. AM-25C3]MBU3602780.1 SDR family oxidoreductase [Polynucleobacter sp. AM-25C3]
MKILVTGSNGFIGKNFIVRLCELEKFQVIAFDRSHSFRDLEFFVDQCDAIVHLAGVNRPDDIKEFSEVNIDLTARLCGMISATNRKIPLIVSSSAQAALANSYGESKLRSEELCKEFALSGNNPVIIFRLPGVFGKWCRPNYNSVVATFCHNVANHLPIQINDPSTYISLVYIDDVIEAFIDILLVDIPNGLSRREVNPVYKISLGTLATQIESFKNCRDSLVSEKVGVGFTRALYSTYVSYLPPGEFVYDLPKYGDERGVFVEMLKTKDSGQFSFFTALPGITRGGHYHHTKTEKFLVIKGKARFGFRNIVTNERYEVVTSEERPQVVETVPGWTHDVTNIGNDEMVAILWANEIFDHQNPDTIVSKV